MLLFSTSLCIRKTMTKEDFLYLVMLWNKESAYQENIIENLKWDGSFPARWGTDTLWLAANDYPARNTAAIRFEKQKEDGSVWDTDYVMNFDSHIMSIRLERSYREDAQIMEDKFSTPHFITLLEQKGWLADDSGLPISRSVFPVQTENLSLLGDIILGKKTYRLPVIYVSRRFDGSFPVDVALLASRVKGVAHVLVLERAEDTVALRALTSGRNEYNGAAGIYFPTDAMEHKRWLCFAKEGYDSGLLEKLVRTAIIFSNSRITEPLLTWQGVNNAILNERIARGIKEKALADQARKKAEQEYRTLQDDLSNHQKEIRRKAAEEAEKEAEKILDGFDNELRYLQKQIENLTRSNEALQIENQGLKSRLDNKEETPLIHAGREKEFYPGELSDLLLTVLSEAALTIPDKTRRSDVIKDILSENPFEHRSEKNAEEIKKLLKTYTGMNAVIRQKLESLGFVITEEGKHCKLTYFGDERYQVILSKTPSDVRTGKNSSQKLSRTAF